MSLMSTQIDKVQHQTAKILQIPLELLEHVLTFLAPQNLVSLGNTCRDFHRHTTRDSLWRTLLCEHLAESDLPNTSESIKSFSQLYLNHHPYWFLVRNRIWFSNKDIYRGQLMVTKLESDGSICGYKVHANLRDLFAESWTLRPGVIIHNGQVVLSTRSEEPILDLPFPGSRRSATWSPADEIRLFPESEQAAESFLALSKDLPADTANVPNVRVWPPRLIPGLPRTRNSEPGDSLSAFTSKGHRPDTLEDISQTSFRMRTIYRNASALLGRSREDVSTWSTLPLELLLPTKQKPYQGLFVGDYASHGCEFLLVLQTDRAPERPSTPVDIYSRNHFAAMLARYRSAQGEEEDTPSWGEVTPNIPDEDGTIHRGALEAIKITGDENIPRGEHTFIADDLGPEGHIRIAHEQPFKGARVVKSRGHIADTRFLADQWLNSELFLIDGNTLAQYWKLFRHISYYRRVDIDTLLKL